MKRYISSGRKDDLMKEKAAWQMKFDARKQLYDDQERNYRKASVGWKTALVDKLNSLFSEYIQKLPGLNISVENYYYGEEGIEIRFKYEHLHDEDYALNWDYTVAIDDEGNIIKKSSSWSGLQATTPAQIDDLMNSVDFLKAIVEFDWEPLLTEEQSQIPKYARYIGIRDPRYDLEYKDPGYDKMIKEAELEDAVGSDIWIKGKGNNRWFKIISQTDKFYKVVSIDDWSVKHGSSYAIEKVTEENPYTERVQKEKFSSMLGSLDQTKTQEEMIELINSYRQ